MRVDWADPQVPADRPCPVCRATEAKRVLLTVDAARAGQPRLQLLDCAACGTAFYDDLTPPAYEYGHSGAGLLTYYVELGAGLDSMFAPLYRIDPARTRSYLEVGCGFGFSLDFARFAFGWTVKGLDPSPLAVAGRAELGLDIDAEFLTADTDFGARFDLVLCSEVLEHLPAPAGLLRLMARTVSDDGALLLTTPNALALHRDAPLGDVLSILTPGFHLILYSPRSLEAILRESGFAHVQVWEQANSLHAVASHRPCPASRPAAVDRAVYRRYLRARIGELGPDSPVTRGLTYRLFKDLVNAGAFHEAEPVFQALCACCRRLYGIDLESPAALTFETAADLDLDEFSRRYPFNLCCTLYFKGMCEFIDRRDSRRAIEYFRAAVRAGSALSVKLSSPVYFVDSETEHLMWQARVHTLYALVSVDAAAAAAEFLLLCDSHPAPGLDARFWRMPASMIGATRRELFVQLVRKGAAAEAKTLLPGLATTLPAGSKLPAQLAAALDKLARGSSCDRPKPGTAAKSTHGMLLAPTRIKLDLLLLSLIHDTADDRSRSPRWRGTSRLVISALTRRFRRLFRRD